MHEFGYAMGRGKKLFVCGPRENIFHYLPNVTVCADFEETKQALLKYQLEMEKNYGGNRTATSIPGSIVYYNSGGTSYGI
jgi:hypothetical protein